jgi:hypothetical protein
LTKGSSGCTAESRDSERVAAPNAAAATPSPNTLTPRLDLENYPHLPLARVHTTQAAEYLALLTEVMR